MALSTNLPLRHIERGWLDVGSREAPQLAAQLLKLVGHGLALQDTVLLGAHKLRPAVVAVIVEVVVVGR